MWTHRHVCVGCIAEPYLQEQLESSADLKVSTCFYCGNRRGGITLDDLAERCGSAIDANFREPNLTPTSACGSGFGDTSATFTLAEVLRSVLNARSDLLLDLEALLHTAWASGNSYDPRFALGPDLDPQGVYHSALAGASVGSNPALVELPVKISEMWGDDEGPIHWLGPGCLIRSLYKARCFPILEAAELALQSPEFAMGFRYCGADDTPDMAWRFSASTDINLAIADARPWMGSYVMTTEFDIKRPIALLDLRRLSEMPPQVDGSYFSSTQARKGQFHAFFRTLQQALNTERHLQEADQCAGFGYRALSKLGAWLHSGDIKIEGVLLSPASTSKWWEEPGCTVLLLNCPSLMSAHSSDSLTAGCSGDGVLRLDWESVSIHQVQRVAVQRVEIASHHFAFREGQGH